MDKIKWGTVAIAIAGAIATGGASVAVAGTSSSAHTANRASVTPGLSRVSVHPMPIMAMSFDYAKLLSQLRGKQLETTFMAGMIPHHEAAIEMALIARGRAAHGELRTTAANIVASQRHEREQMTAWLKAWYGLTPEQAIAASSPAGRRMIQMMDKEMAEHVMMLRRMPAGPEFDKMFLRMMTPHHQMAINEAQPAQDAAVHAQLLLTANTIVMNQEQEVQQMLSWLSSWYGGR